MNVELNDLNAKTFMAVPNTGLYSFTSVYKVNFTYRALEKLFVHRSDIMHSRTFPMISTSCKEWWEFKKIFTEVLQNSSSNNKKRSVKAGSIESESGALTLVLNDSRYTPRACPLIPTAEHERSSFIVYIARHVTHATTCNDFKEQETSSLWLCIIGSQTQYWASGKRDLSAFLLFAKFIWGAETSGEKGSSLYTCHFNFFLN